MYRAFYALKAKPFSLVPQAEFLYMSEQHRRALSLLEYGLVKPSLFSMVTGEVGTGKTMLVRHILRRLNASVTLGIIANTHSAFGEFLQWTLRAFNIEHAGLDKIQMMLVFQNFLMHQYVKNRRTVLVVDEAQNLSIDALEELRMVSNVNVDRQHLLQIILIGQPALRDKLRRPDLQQFAQRIETDYHLRPLSEEEIEPYVEHRLKVAGRAEPGLFDAGALAAIYRISRGVPRIVNLVCDTALVYGFASQRRQIVAATMEELSRDKEAAGGWLFDPAPGGAITSGPIGGLQLREVK